MTRRQKGIASRVLYILQWLLWGMTVGLLIDRGGIWNYKPGFTTVTLNLDAFSLAACNIVMAIRLWITKGDTRLYTSHEVEQIKAEYQRIIDIGKPEIEASK